MGELALNACIDRVGGAGYTEAQRELERANAAIVTMARLKAAAAYERKYGSGARANPGSSE